MRNFNFQSGCVLAGFFNGHFLCLKPFEEKSAKMQCAIFNKLLTVFLKTFQRTNF